MKLCVTQAAPAVHRLSNVYTNWYLLQAGGRLTVLDAGLPGDWREFRPALSRLGHSPDDIDAVLITHHHRDHAGNAERLRSSGARVFSHPADAPYLRGEEHLSDRGVVRYLWRPWYAFYMLSYLAKGLHARHRHGSARSRGTLARWREERGRPRTAPQMTLTR